MIVTFRHRYPILLLILVVVLSGCSSGEVEPTESAVNEAALTEFTAQALATSNSDMTPKTQAIIAHIELPSDTGVYTPLKVWRYEGGQLLPAGTDEFERALGADRDQWPSRTILFAFETITPESAIVEIRTIFDQGIAENSRGGFASKWYLANQDGQWVVDRRDTPYLHWD